MENRYNPIRERYQGIKEALKIVGATAFIVYAIGGSAINVATKTGHPSADLALGISKPTKLERFVLESFGVNPEEINKKN